MPSLAFVTGDFKVFDVEGFRPRMAELRSRVRPKLEVLGKSLAPSVSRSLGGEVFAHVAKHARRTVNPPDDTWVAFSPDARDRKSTRLNSSHGYISYAVFCLKKKKDNI